METEAARRDAADAAVREFRGSGVLPEADQRGGAADFDVMTHMKFTDEAARRTWLSLVLAEGSGVAEDEARFLDRARTRAWVVEEHTSTKPS
jgi:hypothetical protein